MSFAQRLRTPVSAWLATWSPILPILVAEFIIWIGFGSLLPIMPLYFRDHGVDFATLGIVVAAWPAARLIGEPIFGWVADRTRRVPLMVAGAALAGVFEFLPLVFVGAAPFILLRGLAGFATAMYDPAARGTVTDLTPPERRGEAFGLYSAAQMGGLLLRAGDRRPGRVDLRRGGVRVRVRRDQLDRGRDPRRAPGARDGRPRFVAADDLLRPDRVPAPGRRSSPPTRSSPSPPRRRRASCNRLLLAAIIVNIGANFAAGTYDVVWSLYLESLGRRNRADRLHVRDVRPADPRCSRRTSAGGPTAAASSGSSSLGGLAPAITGILYTVMPSPGWAVPLILVEATGFAALTPGALRDRRRRQPAGPIVDRPGPRSAGPGRSGSWRRR